MPPLFNLIYDQDGEESEPELKLTHHCGESVSGLEGGIVGYQGYEEVVAATYTGKVLLEYNWSIGLLLVLLKMRCKKNRKSCMYPIFLEMIKTNQIYTFYNPTISKKHWTFFYKIIFYLGFWPDNPFRGKFCTFNKDCNYYLKALITNKF